MRSGFAKMMLGCTDQVSEFDAKPVNSGDVESEDEKFFFLLICLDQSFFVLLINVKWKKKTITEL